MPTERNRTGCAACPRFIFSSRTNICTAVFLPSPLSTITRHVEKCFDIFSNVRNFPRGFFLFIYIFWDFFLRKEKAWKISPPPAWSALALAAVKKKKHLKTASEIQFKTLLEFILFPHANEQRRRDKANSRCRARRPVRPARETLQTCACPRSYRNRFVSTPSRAFLLFRKKSERGQINRVRFRRLSEHAAAAEEPRAAAVTCLTCPSFSPVALSVSRSPLLPSFLSPPALSLSRSRYLSLSSPRARRRRERRLSVAALVPIWRVRMCRVMYRYLHNPSADVCEDSRLKKTKRKTI